MEKINLQMYSFEDGIMTDYRENLRKVAEMGYAGVELFGPCFEIPAEEMKQLLSELKIEVISLHESTDKIIDLIPYAKTIGLKFMGIGMEQLKDEESVHNFAARLNEIGKVCHEQGIMLTYHNHTQEFTLYNGKRIFDMLIEETNPAYVSFELDAGWCAAAGVDPIQLVRQYSGRIKLIHIKESNKVIGPQPYLDYSGITIDQNGRPIFPEKVKKMLEESKSINCPAGEGIVDWKQLKEIADVNGCEAYIVERETTYKESRIDCLQEDLAYYQTIL